MIFNLFKLHSKEDTPNSWIWVEFDTFFMRNDIINYFKKNKINRTARIISTKLNCGFSTVAKHLIRLIHNVKVNLPLPVMEELINLLNPGLKLRTIKSMNYFWMYNDRKKRS